jgi:shikimate kinase
METKYQLPACIARVVLVGFMGAGKSTVGALLARELQWRFLDADHVLEDRAGKSIAEIFAQEGENFFRALEAEVIKDLIKEHFMVLALGGGAVENLATRQAVLQSPDTCIVFLQAPLEIMIARCEHQSGAALRPVLHDREHLRSRFESRLPHYQNAHLVIETALFTPEETSQQILKAVSSLIKENTPA